MGAAKIQCVPCILILEGIFYKGVGGRYKRKPGPRESEKSGPKKWDHSLPGAKYCSFGIVQKDPFEGTPKTGGEMPKSSSEAIHSIKCPPC